ncbi:hypothetical protein Poli38472_000771 [Pythium oligandrum]|uniref:Heat shock protein 70 n=1 Tax=Pythium oligandrum TaxID=41045 RepID=A0A8K1CC90_PYTOL|nr:hypothetical protein Poli38472_000771 [Pythium oligandrum]|eukprot:TMW60729.1 hypothetical protein Poli38472_000771 [Pythium oligandrum]
MMMWNVRERAEQQCRRPVLDTVLTVPATFNRTQRQVLRDACLISGMKPRSVLVGSTAAGMAHFIDHDGEIRESLVLVVDFGAGSLDVSLISLQKRSRIEIMAVAGDSELGGDVLTERIVTHFIDDYNRQHGSQIVAEASLGRLRRACELAKKMLSSSDRAAIDVRSLFLGGGNFSGSISRTQFEAACVDCWERFKQPIFRVLDESRVPKEAVDRVLLCGGSAQIPRFRLLLEELFVGKSVEIEAKEDLQARGAAIYAASMAKLQPFNSLTLERVTPLALGLQRIGVRDTVVLLRSNTRLPVSKSQVLFSTPQKDVTYQILEGNVLQQTASVRNVSKEQAHCLGMIRFDLSSVVVPLVVKIEVVFDIDALDSLVVTAMEASSGKVQTIACLGDDTLLPRDSIAQLREELVQRRGFQTPISPNSVSSTQLTNLVEYSAALQRMMSGNSLEITINNEDEKRVLVAKLEGISRWLQSASTSPSAANMETMKRHLQTLRRLHFSMAATCALAHLRETDL